MGINLIQGPNTASFESRAGGEYDSIIPGINFSTMLVLHDEKNPSVQGGFFPLARD